MAKKRNKTRAEPDSKVISWLCSQDAYDMLTCQGYPNQAHNPKIIAGVDTSAKLAGDMSIHL